MRATQSPSCRQYRAGSSEVRNRRSDSGPGNYMIEIAQRLTMGSNVSAPVVLSKIRESASSAKDFVWKRVYNLFPLKDVTMLFLRGGAGLALRDFFHGWRC